MSGFLQFCILCVLFLMFMLLLDVWGLLRKMRSDTEQLKKLTEQLKGPTDSLEKAVNENKKE